MSLPLSPRPARRLSSVPSLHAVPTRHPTCPKRSSRTALITVLATLVATLVSSPSTSSAATPRVHAIVGARIVLSPGHVIDRGTVVMRDGVITAVGKDVVAPADARIWEGDSLTVYPGLIDAFVLPAEPPAGQRPGPPATGQRPAPPPEPSRGAAHSLPSVRPEFRVVESLPLSGDQLESLRAAGFAAAQVAPRKGIVRGSTALIGLSGGSPNAVVIKPDASQVVALQPEPMGYPGSLMGAIAVIRQAFMDAHWYHDAGEIYARSPAGKPRPEENVSWEALQPVIGGKQPAMFVASEMLEVLRAGAVAREAGVRAQVLGAGDEYKRAKDIAAAGLPLIVPVNFPDPPDVSDPDNALDVSTEELRDWNQAPGNPAALSRAGVTFALTSNGLKDVKSFRGNVAKAIQRGLDPGAALAAVTTVPAQLLGLSDRLGTIAVGKIANLTVTRGDLFSEKSKVREVWVDGERLEVPDKEDRGMKGNWSLAWNGSRGSLIVTADKDTTVKLVVGADTLLASNIRLDGDRLYFSVRIKDQPTDRFELVAKNDRVTGTTHVKGLQITGGRLPEPEGASAAKQNGGEKGTPNGGEKKGAGEETAKAVKDEPVVTPVVMGNTEAWRMPIPPQPEVVVVRNATVWTAGPRGTVEGADLLIKNGRIAGVGKHLPTPPNALVIDGTGKHVAPGIIDCHSHSAIVGNVNECTNSVTAEVRIQDVINSESLNIYRQLAGGTTIMHLLHGSCNAIGGQCAVIKCRWGEPPDRLLFTAAPPTIKFALGENPKQSNWDDRPLPPRYPQSRAGVEETIRDAFTRARDYRAAWEEWRHKKRPYPPRRDLQLDALLEIVESRRFIHCHSYRQDEILMLMRLAEQFGIKVQTFQHVLEGYKVADEMASHGAGASTFSDWWAYKFEVIDAIPYNGYLMWDRGVTVSYNSDSDELARRLNTEAAKAIKYGGAPPEEAIKFVTLNPAKQLRVDDRVGSLVAGKDADFSIWDGSPLSPFSHCEQTWIEGRKYFDRAEDLAGRAALARERDELIARARSAKKEGPGAGPKPLPAYLEDTNLSGNDCGDSDEPFMSEELRRELREGEVQR